MNVEEYKILIRKKIKIHSHGCSNQILKISDKIDSSIIKYNYLI